MLLVPIDFIGHRYTGDTDDPEIVNINKKKSPRMRNRYRKRTPHRTCLYHCAPTPASILHSPQKKERKRNTAIAFIFTQTCSRRLSNASVVTITHGK